MNYTFRMHDPRAGRFLSLDPLAPKYPHNSPYAFEENRVIDGIELEGLEFLKKEDAMVEMRFGAVYLKLENFSNLTQNKVQMANRSGMVTTRSDGTQVFGFDSEVIGKFTLQPIQADVNDLGLPTSFSDGRLADFGTISEGGIAKPSNKAFTIRIPSGYDKFGAESNRSIRRNLRIGDLSPTSVPTGTRVGAGSALAIGICTEIYKNYAIFTNVFEEKSVNEHSALLLNDVMGAISYAIRIGMIPYENINEKDISDIANVILFGGNGDEGIKIRSLGLKIYDELTAEGLAKKLSEFFFKSKSVEKSKSDENLTDEQNEAVKVQDKTKVGNGR